MDNYIKLPSDESGFSTSAGSVNLCTFRIPGNSGSYDLSQSHINVNVQGLQVNNQAITGADATTPAPIFDLQLDFNSGQGGTSNDVANNTAVSSTAVLVKNARLRTDKGVLEEIRNVAGLRNNLGYYSKSQNQIYQNLNGLAVPPKMDQFGFQAQNQVSGIGNDLGENKNVDIMIPLSEIYELGKVDSFNTSYFGQSSLELELNLDKLKMNLNNKNANGSTLLAQNSNADGFAIKYENMENVTATADGGKLGTTDNPLITSAKYSDIRNSPFYVGMLVKVAGTFTQGGAQTFTQIISKIELLNKVTDNTNKGRLRIILANGVGTLDNTNTATVLKVSNADQGGAGSINVNKCELVLKRTSDDSGQSMEYMTYKSQEDTTAPSSSINRSYSLPPQTMNAYIMFINSNNPYSHEAQISDYRISLNGDMVTSRQVKVLSPLHYDQLSRVFMNDGQIIKNLQEQGVSSLANPNFGVGDQDKLPITILAVPVTLSNEQTLLGLEVNAKAGQQLSGKITVYSKCIKKV